MQPVISYEPGYPAAMSGRNAVVAKPKRSEMCALRLMCEQDAYRRKFDLASMARWQPLDLVGVYWPGLQPR